MDALHLGVLIRLLRSSEARERDVAVRALRETDPESITPLLRDPRLAPEAIEYFARHAGERRDWISALLDNPSLSDEDRAVLAASAHALPEAAEPVQDAESDMAEDGDLPLAQRIQKMSVGQRVKTAMKGDKEVRSILIKDTNRDVYMAVLKNPGLKENEIEMLTKNTGTSVDILRAIAGNREWVANRNILNGLVLNPKTPPSISIRFLARLGRKEIEFISKSRALPVALRNSAKRIVSAKVRKK